MLQNILYSVEATLLKQFEIQPEIQSFNSQA